MLASTCADLQARPVLESHALAKVDFAGLPNEIQCLRERLQDWHLEHVRRQGLIHHCTVGLEERADPLLSVQRDCFVSRLGLSVLTRNACGSFGNAGSCANATSVRK